MPNVSAFPLSSANKTVDIGYTGKYNTLVGKGGNRHYHKSLDFSDVGIPTNTGDMAANKHLRQFHQTRIYIEDFENMNAHGENSTSNKSQTYLISANLPESFSYKIGSQWSQPFSSQGANGPVNALMQFVGDKVSKFAGRSDNPLSSGVNRMGTMKVWNGSEPLSLNLSIPVIDDGHGPGQSASGINTNFVEALEFLGSLCLPKSSGALGFYVPPPSPVNLNVKYSETGNINFQSTYGRIILQLGGILLVDHCIIEGISVTYPNTKTMIRHYYDKDTGTAGNSGTDYLVPLLATLNITVSTVEAMTADYYSRMLWLKKDDEGGMGSGTADLTAIPGAISQVIGAVDSNISSFLGIKETT